jgi:chromosome segregation ATPase
MTEEQLNNTEDPLCGFAPPQTLEQAIQSINRLLWSDGVEDDDHADAEVVKSFLVNDNMQEIAQKKLYKDRVSKTIPVMETTIEGAQGRIEDCIEWVESELEKWENEGYSASDLSPLHNTATKLEYIGVFLDSVGDEMAAISSAHNSLHDRLVEAVAAIDEWKDNFEAVNMSAARYLNEKIELQRKIHRLREENQALRKANLNNLHAANDNG